VPQRHHLDRRAGNIACDGPDDELLNTKTVAALLGVSRQWLEIGRSKRKNGEPYGPPFLRLAPQVIRYRRSAVKEWLTKRSVAPTEHNDN
jgi:predicted DNA-binding transcriptional regulator AlpA